MQSVGETKIVPVKTSVTIFLMQNVPWCFHPEADSTGEITKLYVLHGPSSPNTSPSLSPSASKQEL